MKDEILKVRRCTKLPFFQMSSVVVRVGTLQLSKLCTVISEQKLSYCVARASAQFSPVRKDPLAFFQP